MRIAVLGCVMIVLALVPTSTVKAFDLSGVHSGNDTTFDDGYARRAKERSDYAFEQKRRLQAAWQNRDRSKDVCFQFASNTDARRTCLGEEIGLIEDERARNIMFGYCASLGDGELARGLADICDRGADSCFQLDDTQAAIYCEKCGGTRNWLATYSLGHLIKCFPG